MCTGRSLTRYGIHGEINDAASGGALAPPSACLTLTRGGSSEGGSGVPQAASGHRCSDLHQP